MKFCKNALNLSAFQDNFTLSRNDSNQKKLNLTMNSGNNVEKYQPILF